VINTTALFEPDDFYIGHYAYIVTDAGGLGAAPQAEERPVTDYDQGTGTLTVSPAFSAAVGSGDTYELLALKRADITAAINAAIRQAGETWLVPKKYSDPRSSGITADIKAGMEPMRLDLKSP